MTTDDATLLTEHGPFLERLARAIVRDEDLSRDVVQQAWLTALARGGPDRGPITRGWLGGVVRNVARRTLRGERRRAAREARVAQDAACDETPVVEQLEVCARVAEAARGLPEPYRTAVFLRYYRDRSPSAIARELGVPIATVKSRLQRGLALLRAELDARCGGDRQAWLGALAAFGVGRPVAVLELMKLGAAVMSMHKTTFPIAVLTVACLLAVSWFVGGNRSDGKVVRREPERLSASEVADTEGPTIPPRVETAEHAAESVSKESVHPSVRGLVVDTGGRPVAGLTIVTERGFETASDGDGRFDLPSGRSSATFGVGTRGWSTVLTGLFRLGRPDVEPFVVAAPSIRIAGTVRTADGNPAAGRLLHIALGQEAIVRLRRELDGGRRALFHASSADDGRFEFPAVPAVEGLRLFAENEKVADLPPRDDLGLEIVLPEAEPGASAPSLRGRVVDVDGRPVTGASVVLGAQRTRSGEDGEFELELTEDDDTRRLIAFRAGWQPCVLERPERGWDEPVELQLGSETLAIRGHVVDADGRPVENARVWIEERTLAGEFGGSVKFFEQLLVDDRVSHEYEEVSTGPDGAFEIEGLLERDYELAAMRAGPEFVKSAPTRVAAGSTDVVLRLPAGRGATVPGRLVSRHGHPVAGAVVHGCWIYRQVHIPGPHPYSSPRRWLINGVRTDRDGRFEISDVPPGVHHLYVAGDPVIDGAVPIPPGRPRDSLVVEVPLRCRFQVVVSDPDCIGEHVAVVDRDGEPLWLLIVEANRTSSSTRHRLVDGRTPVLTVSDAAHEILVHRGDEVVLRRAVALRPGVVERVFLP